MEIIKIPLSDLTPDPNNAKDHPDWQIEQIKNSIEQFGNLDPIGVWGDDNLIVEGHGRYEALKELGFYEAECIRLDWLTEEERKAYALAHNKLTMNSGFIPDALDMTLAAIGEIDMSQFGFRVGDWFKDREKNDDSRQEGNDEYNEFLDKFEAKKTTDDCYTPEIVYDTVAKWVAKEYAIDLEKFVRPFYPGGDYQNEKYPDGCVVVDNPPFSILSEILNYYVERGVKFFLFAPTLTLFSGRGLDICYLPIGAAITYENGAKVNTSFITNLEQGLRIRTSGEFNRLLKEANDANQKEQRTELPNYEYPPELVTAASLSRYSVHGVDFIVPSNECYRVSELDAMKESGKSIFGGGFLLSEQSTRRNAEAIKQKEENIKNAEIERLKKATSGVECVVNEKGMIVWTLSEREREIVKSLGGDDYDAG